MIRLSLCVLVSGFCAVAETPLPGHSHQGHAFNEGPRYPTVPIRGVGEVRFPVRTKWKDGQAYFNQGVGQLHGFWYFEAERTFRTMASHDPACAMAYWGMAMANWENKERAKEFIQRAVERIDQASPRNQAYIRAHANYLDGDPKDEAARRHEMLKDLEDLIHEHPDDIEAKAFLACRIWQFSYYPPKIRIPSHEAVDALLQQVFAKSPMHPAHHYRIHLWDKRKASRAIDSAAKLGFTAPAIAHMWHMPGHIYSNLQRYEDAVWHQLASARIDHAHMAEHLLLPDQIFNYAHNNEWLTRNWIHLGNCRAAIRMSQSLLANPRHPKLNSMKGKAHSFRYGRMRLIQVLEQFECWEEALKMCRNGWLETLPELEHELPRRRLIGLSHYHLGQEKPLQKLMEELNGELQAAKTAAEEIADKEQAKKKVGQAKQIDRLIKELNGCLATLDGDKETALAALEKSPRPKQTLAREYLLLGNQKKAQEFSEANTNKRMTLPLATRISILHQLGETEAAKEAFEKLRTVSSWIDLEATPFARLSPIAKEFGYPEDWRKPHQRASNFGERPESDQMGPVYWQPPAAPGFTLPDLKSHRFASSGFAGKPVILVFYLGYGCVHCAEQLNAIANRISDFKQAGLRVVAISTDKVDDLSKSLGDEKSVIGSSDLPLLADPEMAVFRKYHAYDQFEGETLHGTFLIDPDNRILWSNIAADPFMDLDFLIAESRRILKLHADGRGWLNAENQTFYVPPK